MENKLAEVKNDIVQPDFNSFRNMKIKVYKVIVDFNYIYKGYMLSAAIDSSILAYDSWPLHLS